MEQTLERWRAITDNRELVRFVAGMFSRLAIHVSDREERLTVVHDGDQVTLLPGADEKACDYLVTIDAHEADRLADEASRPHLGEVERFRIMRAMFTPATAATLRTPPMDSPVLKWLSGAESIIHVRLLSPIRDEPDGTHTLIYASWQWLVIPGLHGKPKRLYTMTVEQSADYQRRVHKLLTHGTLAGWIRFGRWYRQWRRDVSVRV